jgi:magnesium-transporting ATPase (P-type)
LLFGLAIVVLAFLAVCDPAAPISTVRMIFVYITITLPAGVLSVQPAFKTVMKEPSRPPTTESIIDREIIMDTLYFIFC